MAIFEHGGAMSTAAEALAGLGRRDWRLLIDGELVPAKDGRVEPVVDPSTGEVIASAPWASAADVDAACRAADAASGAWGALTVPERSVYLRRYGEALSAHAEEIAQLDAIDSGNPVSAMRMEVKGALTHIDRWCGLALSLNGAVLPASKDGLHYTSYQPYGVVAKIVPFNHPQLFVSTRMIAPLLAGNSLVFKVAEQTPLVALRIGELAQEIFPPGVFNVLTGGPDVGDALVVHPTVRRISFIGSATIGRLIQRRAAEHAVKNVSLELGGKNALIVMPDADLEGAVAGAVHGMNFGVSQGQSCGSTSRLLVHESVYEEFVDAYAAKISQINVGPAWLDETEMGPVVSDAQRAKAERYIDAAKQDGGRVVTGGGRPSNLDGGFYVEPTIIADVKPGDTIFREEIFGPVVAATPWSDYESVIEMANSVEYGLTGSIWTEDLTLAHKTAERLHTGYVWINDSATHYWGTPFGGVKESGLGREESIEEFTSYLEQKVTHVKFSRSAEEAFSAALARRSAT